jgi:hypothetical protein
MVLQQRICQLLLLAQPQLQLALGQLHSSQRRPTQQRPRLAAAAAAVLGSIIRLCSCRCCRQACDEGFSLCYTLVQGGAC